MRPEARIERAPLRVSEFGSGKFDESFTGSQLRFSRPERNAAEAACPSIVEWCRRTPNDKVDRQSDRRPYLISGIPFSRPLAA
jgi:hypothetical protein